MGNAHGNWPARHSEGGGYWRRQEKQPSVDERIGKLCSEHNVKINGSLLLEEKIKTIKDVIARFDADGSLAPRWSREAVRGFRSLLADLMGSPEMVKHEIVSAGSLVLSLRSVADEMQRDADRPVQHETKARSADPALDPARVLHDGRIDAEAFARDFDQNIRLLFERCWPWVDAERFFARRKLQAIERGVPVEKEFRIVMGRIFKLLSSMSTELGRRFSGTFAFADDELEVWAEERPSHIVERIEHVEADLHAAPKKIVAAAVHFSGLGRCEEFTRRIRYTSISSAPLNALLPDIKQQIVEVWVALESFPNTQECFIGMYKIPESFILTWQREYKGVGLPTATPPHAAPAVLAPAVPKQISPSTTSKASVVVPTKTAPIPVVTDTASASIVAPAPVVVPPPVAVFEQVTPITPLAETEVLITSVSDDSESQEDTFLAKTDERGPQTLLAQIDSLVTRYREIQNSVEDRLLLVLDDVEAGREVLKGLEATREQLRTLIEGGQMQDVMLTPTQVVAAVLSQPSSPVRVTAAPIRAVPPAISVPARVDLPKPTESQKVPKASVDIMTVETPETVVQELQASNMPIENLIIETIRRCWPSIDLDRFEKRKFYKLVDPVFAERMRGEFKRAMGHLYHALSGVDGGQQYFCEMFKFDGQQVGSWHKEGESSAIEATKTLAEQIRAMIKADPRLNCARIITRKGQTSITSDAKFELWPVDLRRAVVELVARLEEMPGAYAEFIKIYQLPQKRIDQWKRECNARGTHAPAVNGDATSVEYDPVLEAQVDAVVQTYTVLRRNVFKQRRGQRRMNDEAYYGSWNIDVRRSIAVVARELTDIPNGIEYFSRLYAIPLGIIVQWQTELLKPLNPPATDEVIQIDLTPAAPAATNGHPMVSLVNKDAFATNGHADTESAVDLATAITNFQMPAIEDGRKNRTFTLEKRTEILALCNRIRSEGARGQLSAFLKAHNIVPHVSNWEKEAAKNGSPE